MLPRFVALAAFLVAVAVLVWLAELAEWVVVVAMVLAAAIACSFSWLAWRDVESRRRTRRPPEPP